MTAEYHRDSRKFIENNCKICELCEHSDEEEGCPYDSDGVIGIPVYLGAELAEKYPEDGYDARKFYFKDVCDYRIVKDSVLER